MFREVTDYRYLCHGTPYWVKFVAWEAMNCDVLSCSVGVYIDGGESGWFQDVHGNFMADLDRVVKVWTIEGPGGWKDTE